MIPNHRELVCFHVELPSKLGNIITANDNKLYFTRASLKHLSEKQKNPKESLDRIEKTLRGPNSIYVGRNGRYIFVKVFHKGELPYPFVVSLEVSEKIIIITAFSSNEKYLKQFEILWRTETLADDSSIST